MNSKAFTLFTALVSFILIVLTILISQSMLRVESNALTMMSDLEEQKELQSIVDLARADALQTFNYDIRYVLEDYFSTNTYPIYENDTDIAKVKQTFINEFFVGTNPKSQTNVRAFSEKLVRTLENILTEQKDPRGYTITLDIPQQRNKTVTAMQNAMKQSAIKDNFMEIVTDCKGNFEDCDGSFYINLDFASLTNEEYESLPALKITSNTTERTIRQPIIPRGNMRIYVPIRLFKAFKAALILREKITPVKKEIQKYELGFCKGCGPITNPKKPKGSDNWTNPENKTCPKQNIEQEITMSNSLGSYKDNSSSIKTELNKISKEDVFNGAKELLLPAGLGSIDNEFEISIDKDSTDTVVNTSLERENRDSTSPMNLACGFVESFDVVLAFKELNEDYKVLKEKEPVYKIRIHEELKEHSLTNGACKTDNSQCVKTP